MIDILYTTTSSTIPVACSIIVSEGSKPSTGDPVCGIAHDAMSHDSAPSPNPNPAERPWLPGSRPCGLHALPHAQATQTMVRAGVCENIIICQPTNQPTNDVPTSTTTWREEGILTVRWTRPGRPGRAGQGILPSPGTSQHYRGWLLLVYAPLLHLPSPANVYDIEHPAGREMRYSAVDIQSLVDTYQHDGLG